MESSLSSGQGLDMITTGELSSNWLGPGRDNQWKDLFIGEDLDAIATEELSIY